MTKKRTPSEALEATPNKRNPGGVRCATCDDPEMSQKAREAVRRASNRFDALRSAVREAMATPPELTVPPMPKRDRRKVEERIAVLHLADTQIGKRTSRGTSSGSRTIST